MSTLRPFRFAVQATKAKSGSEWRDLARRVEDLGYSTLFLADHYLGHGPAQKEARWPPQYLAPIAAMATAAAVTETLRVGCRVFCVDYHVPAVLAKETATIDLLSDGRLELGIGAGWSEPEYRAMGVPYETPGQRIKKLTEVIALLRAHWSGQDLNQHGEFVNVTGYAGLPRPVQQPHPPIMIGGGRRRVLSLAGREADIVSISTVPFAAVNEDGLTPAEEAARRLGYVRDAAGERFAGIDIETSPFFTRITKDAEEADAAVARVAAAMRVDPVSLPNHPNMLVGSPDEVAERLQERREAFGMNYITVQQSEIESFAPVAARLSGR
ncbi:MULTISPECIES: TIGR03621 family F420-dependent LLM class oxidoreductase [unclassified Parafrankia]|uniref:TIGR03621 family F420-dependent LLM class oxidoreductase n=1 Tax=Parafrankia TaxID=2994362 RepID=UPI000DA4EBD1|nr:MULTISPECIES: TIGR03621 family F420-dependent LLM class oxidoreductase [unclassified Parafrankia]TCJ32914.1 TIGR03621 family F420-dependent LLM class oxidoreductase [Parafrankia sp. BMG5.11]CAI7974428.1 TIGR03621 family F420-dependent LLM class oxidoreductase [Frankia sp. Hr75.2]SQD94997.1 Luciferase family protein [Parafrankia sp. Ea1.12]